VSPRVRFEDEADAEYRDAGRWYEGRRAGLGLAFFDAVDAAISQIVDLPQSAARIPRLPACRIAGAAISSQAIPVSRRYLEVEGAIRILAIAHDRRKPGYWKERLRASRFRTWSA
jgi:toxin ParE1/3/4